MTAVAAAAAAESGPRKFAEGSSLVVVARRLPRETAITAVRAASRETKRFCMLTIGWIAAWNALLHKRRALADLDDRMLRDIGLTPPAFFRECAKPSWW